MYSSQISEVLSLIKISTNSFPFLEITKISLSISILFIGIFPSMYISSIFDRLNISIYLKLDLIIFLLLFILF